VPNAPARSTRSSKRCSSQIRYGDPKYITVDRPSGVGDGVGEGVGDGVADDDRVTGDVSVLGLGKGVCLADDSGVADALALGPGAGEALEAAVGGFSPEGVGNGQTLTIE